VSYRRSNNNKKKKFDSQPKTVRPDLRVNGGLKLNNSYAVRTYYAWDLYFAWPEDANNSAISGLLVVLDRVDY
jgi:hypothetical protein